MLVGPFRHMEAVAGRDGQSCDGSSVVHRKPPPLTPQRSPAKQNRESVNQVDDTVGVNERRPGSTEEAQGQDRWWVLLANGAVGPAQKPGISLFVFRFLQMDDGATCWIFVGFMAGHGLHREWIFGPFWLCQFGLLHAAEGDVTRAAAQSDLFAEK